MKYMLACLDAARSHFCGFAAVAALEACTVLKAMGLSQLCCKGNRRCRMGHNDYGSSYLGIIIMRTMIMDTLGHLHKRVSLEHIRPFANPSPTELLYQIACTCTGPA